MHESGMSLAHPPGLPERTAQYICISISIHSLHDHYLPSQQEEPAPRKLGAYSVQRRGRRRGAGLGVAWNVERGAWAAKLITPCPSWTGPALHYESALRTGRRYCTLEWYLGVPLYSTYLLCSQRGVDKERGLADIAATYRGLRTGDERRGEGEKRMRGQDERGSLLHSCTVQL
jgi:hypothetical protein